MVLGALGEHKKVAFSRTVAANEPITVGAVAIAQPLQPQNGCLQVVAGVA
jgi:hypothetical protein